MKRIEESAKAAEEIITERNEGKEIVVKIEGKETKREETLLRLHQEFPVQEVQTLLQAQTVDNFVFIGKRR